MNDLLSIWSSSPGMSLVVWALIAMIILYAGRKPAHNVFKITGRTIFRTMRLWSYTLNALEQRLNCRNREILLANGAKEAEKYIEREFFRVNNIVERDLSQYPTLHRQICDVIDKIEQDYKGSSDTAPLPPAWSEVVETITALPQSGDPAVNKILQNVKNAVEESHSKTLKTYKDASSQRHKLLASMIPNWRKMQSTLNEVNGKITSIDERSKSIDTQMDNYQKIRHGEGAAVSALTSSSLTQFFISGLVLIIAVLGGLINFQLIAMPMSEMVGGASYIGSMKTSDIAALVLILIEIAMGLFLVESLRITHLFPVISSMDDRLRKRMAIVSFTILAILACIEASLAYMRDLLALDREALQASLTGAGVEIAHNAALRWIPSVGQMIMGFILPFALVFIAIPLESFIHSLRIVLGVLGIGILRALRVVIRMCGGIANHLSLLCVHLYDLLIMLPLGLERIVHQQLNRFALTQQKPIKQDVAESEFYGQETSEKTTADLEKGIDSGSAEPAITPQKRKARSQSRTSKDDANNSRGLAPTIA